jgi:Dolichyl-phosphate-mannose-protein mannosyltransferase
MQVSIARWGMSRKWMPPALAAFAFALLSLALLPYPGLQDDEVLFTEPLYRAPGTKIPLVLMSYLGTLKTWFYAAIFTWFPPSRWSVRVPMVLAGAVTIWLTWVWTRRVAGTRAAVFSVALLATDSVFILTNTFDWGPVALQHLLLMGGLVAIQAWLENDSKWFLALGFFLWGLGLWDKALMIWPLIGLAVATLCIYPKELRRHLRRVPLLIACASLLLGALPMFRYNIARHGETLSANTRLSLRGIPRKVEELRETMNGSVLLEAMVATTAGPIARTPQSLTARMSVAVRTLSGSHSENWMLPVFGLSLACLLFPGRRVLVFLLIAMAVTWLQMAANTGTGGGAHHVILLWPFPCVFVGVALARIADRVRRWLSRAVVALVALVVFINVLNTNEYLADLALNGAVSGWTDAFYRLTGAVSHYKSGQIGIVDWGYLNGLRMMYEGDLKLALVSDFAGKPAGLAAMIASHDFVFVQHTEDKQIFPDVNGRLRSAGLSLGYAEQVQRVVHDDEGRPVFEIFRFEKTTP